MQGDINYNVITDSPHVMPDDIQTNSVVIDPDVIDPDVIDPDVINSVANPDTDPIECIFCKEDNRDLYKSTVCACNHIYFCKQCITKNQSHSKNCPQCATPLNLSVSDPTRVCCCRTINCNYIKVIFDYIANMEPVSANAYLFIAWIIRAICVIILFVTSVTGKGVMKGIVFGVFIGVLVLYSVPIHFSKQIHYDSSPYIYFVNKLSSDSEVLSKNYSFLSPYTFIKVTSRNAFCIFSFVFYIPLITSIVTALYMAVSLHNQQFNLKYTLLLILPHSSVICAHIKYVLSMLVAYIVSGIYEIGNNDEFTMKGNITHITTFLIFILLTFLFGIVLHYPIDNNKKDLLWAISTHIILNFFFFIEVCKFFKYDHGIRKNEAGTYIYTRNTFLCKYDNEENEGNPDHEKYYLFGISSCEKKFNIDIVSWYFGKGVIGRIRIFSTYVILPFIFQFLGFLSYVHHHNEKLYTILICMSYGGFIMQTIFKYIILSIYIIIKCLWKKCFICCTVETEPGEVMDVNIEHV